MKYYFLLFIYFIVNINATDYKILEADLTNLDWEKIKASTMKQLAKEEKGKKFSLEVNQDPKGLKIIYKDEENETPEMQIGAIKILGGLMRDDELIQMVMELETDGRKYMSTVYQSIGALMGGMDEDDDDFLGWLASPEKIPEFITLSLTGFQNECDEKFVEPDGIDILPKYLVFIKDLENSFNEKKFKQTAFDLEKGEIVEKDEIKIKCESLKMREAKKITFHCKSDNNPLIKLITGEIVRQKGVWRVSISHFGEDFNYFWTDSMLEDSEDSKNTNFEDLVKEFLISIGEYGMYTQLTLEDFTDLVNYKLEHLEIHALGDKEKKIGLVKDNCERIRETKEELVSPICDYFVNSYNEKQFELVEDPEIIKEKTAVNPEKDDVDPKLIQTDEINNPAIIKDDGVDSPKDVKKVNKVKRKLNIAKKNKGPKMIINKKSKNSMTKKIYYEKNNRKLKEDYCPIDNSQIKTSFISIKNFHYFFLKMEFVQFKQEHYIAFQNSSDISAKIDFLLKDLQTDIEHWVLNKKGLEDKTEKEIEQDVLELDFYKKLVTDKFEQAGVAFSFPEKQTEKNFLFLNKDHHRLLKISELQDNYLRFNFYYTPAQKKMNDIREEVTVKRDKKYNQDYYLLKSLDEFIEVQKKEKKIL